MRLSSTSAAISFHFSDFGKLFHSFSSNAGDVDGVGVVVELSVLLSDLDRKGPDRSGPKTVPGGWKETAA